MHADKVLFPSEDACVHARMEINTSARLRLLWHHVPAPIIARPIVIVYSTAKGETKVKSSELNDVTNCD